MYKIECFRCYRRIRALSAATSAPLLYNLRNVNARWGGNAYNVFRSCLNKQRAILRINAENLSAFAFSIGVVCYLCSSHYELLPVNIHKFCVVLAIRIEQEELV